MAKTAGGLSLHEDDPSECEPARAHERGAVTSSHNPHFAHALVSHD